MVGVGKRAFPRPGSNQLYDCTFSKLSTYFSWMSLDSGGPDWISWPEPYSEFLQWVREFWLSEEKARKKDLPNHFLHSCKRVSRIICGLLYKYPLRLYHTYHHSVTLLGTFPCCFDGHMDVPLHVSVGLQWPFCVSFVVGKLMSLVINKLVYPSWNWCDVLILIL